MFQSERFFREAWPTISQAPPSPAPAPSRRTRPACSSIGSGTRSSRAVCSCSTRAIATIPSGRCRRRSGCRWTTARCASRIGSTPPRAVGTRAGGVCPTKPATRRPVSWWVRPRSVSTPPTSCAPCSVPSAGVRWTCTERSTARRSRSTRRAWSSSPASSGRPTERKGDASMPADSRPLVVVSAPLHTDAVSILEREYRVVLTEDPTEEAMIKTAAEAQGILFRGRPRSSASLMEACKRLKVVGRHGVGLDSVDIPAATRLGIAVVHAPGSNSQAVAEHALMLMLACTKRIVTVDKQTRAGDWSARGHGGDGAIYVNTSRGGVQDERAVFEALTRGKLGAAGIDVFEQEPTALDNPILNLPNVVVSCHVAGVTNEANRQMGVQVVGEMLCVLRGERPDVLVNPDVWPRLGQR